MMPFRLVAPIAALCVALACRPQADLVISGGVLWTGGDAASPGVVAIENDKIVAVGDSADVWRFVGPQTERLDAAGGLVIPGFADGHTHMSRGGFQLTSVDLRDAGTPEEFIRRVAAYAKTLRPGEWILGGDWDHELWRGSPLPRRSWIDSVTPNNPVFVNRLDGHMALANSAAIGAAHVTRDTAAPAGGEIVRDPRTGEPLGIFKDAAMDLIDRVIPAPSAEQLDSALARATRRGSALGVTATSHVSASWADVASWRRLERAGLLTMRVILYLPLSWWQEVADTVRRSGAGDDWVRIGGLKAYVDGSAGSRTAYFFEPFSDSAGCAGLMQTSEADLRRWIGGADSAGLQLAIHAIGDRANALLLDTYDSVARAHGVRDRRFRIEHAQHLRPQDIPRFAALGVIASMQPYHAIDDGRWLERRIGPTRIKTTYAFRDLLEVNATVALGSDWTVAPLDPVLGIYAAVTRRTIDGRYPRGWVPEQKITVGQALQGYTWANAFATFDEEKRGSLVPGQYADVVVLERNLFAVPADSLDRVGVRYTVVGGRVVYRK
jgi:predicted amidohydrolase YtcJ